MVGLLPGFEEPFKVLTLPRIPDISFAGKVVVALILSPDSSVIDVAISKAVISCYIIRPTPKLVWSYALGRTTIVDSLETCLDANGNKIYVAGVTERKKSRLLVLETANAKLSAHDQETSLADFGLTTALELSVTSPIRGIKILKNGTHIVMVHADGSVQLASHTDSKVELLDPSFGMSSVKSKAELTYHTFIDDIRSKTICKEFLLQLVKRNDQYTYRMISINTEAGFLEINQKLMPLFTASFSFAYSANTIFQLNNDTFEITALNATTFEPLKSLSVSSLCTTQASIFAPAPGRLLLSLSNKIHLLNFELSSLLGSHHVVKAETALVLKAAIVSGAALQSSRSLSCFLTANVKHNSTDLNMVDFTVGTNTLKESLGKGIPTAQAKSQRYHGLSNLINPQFVAESLELSSEVSEVFDVLKTMSLENNIHKWERIAVPYLKNEAWSSIKASLQKKPAKADKIHEFREFDVEADRQVDIVLINDIVALILELDESSGVEFAKDSFVPEYTLVYLLTHPLFPKHFTRGLLSLFRASGRDILLRQAIITCPNLSLNEILLEMIQGCTEGDVEECDTFEDSLNRVVNEFSTSAIAEGLRQIRDNLANEPDGSFDLSTLLNRLLQISGNSNSWYFIELVIDVGGLFTWLVETVTKLEKLVEAKVQKLVENSYNLTLASQALLTNIPIYKKGTKKKNKHNGKATNMTDNILAADTYHKAQLHSILKIKNFTNLLDGELSSELATKAPLYSIEKLTV